MQGAQPTFVERLLIKFDSWPWQAIPRSVLGFFIPPAFRLILGAGASIWTTFVLFVGLLVALRVVPAISRKILRFSAEAKEIWSERRRLSKRSDSYQWQKLFWIGLGMLFYGLIAGGLQSSEKALALSCFISGGVGLLFWVQIPASERAPAS